MRKLFKIISILNIFAIIFFILGFIVVAQTTSDPKIIGIIERSEIFFYVSGIILLLGSAGNITFGLNENLWKKAEDLDNEKFKWYKGNEELAKQKQKLADAIIRTSK